MAAGREPISRLVRRAPTGPEVAAPHDRLRQLDRCAFAHQRRRGTMRSLRAGLSGKRASLRRRARVVDAHAHSARESDATAAAAYVSWRSGQRGQQPCVMGRWSSSGMTTVQAPGHPPAGLALAGATAAHGLAGTTGAPCAVRSAAARRISGGMRGGGGGRVMTADNGAGYVPRSAAGVAHAPVEFTVHRTIAS